LNDVFKAVAPGMQQTLYFRVFNRWGKLLFETKNINRGWDGTYKGKMQSADVYVWIIKGFNVKGEVITMKGTVTLIN
jgi:gliding motility-associated-like protein